MSLGIAHTLHTQDRLEFYLLASAATNSGQVKARAREDNERASSAAFFDARAQSLTRIVILRH